MVRKTLYCRRWRRWRSWWRSRWWRRRGWRTATRPQIVYNPTATCYLHAIKLATKRTAIAVRPQTCRSHKTRHTLQIAVFQLIKSIINHLIRPARLRRWGLHHRRSRRRCNWRRCRNVSASNHHTTSTRCYHGLRSTIHASQSWRCHRPVLQRSACAICILITHHPWPRVAHRPLITRRRWWCNWWWCRCYITQSHVRHVHVGCLRYAICTRTNVLRRTARHVNVLHVSVAIIVLHRPKTTCRVL